jgi:hypothetical protein
MVGRDILGIKLKAYDNLSKNKYEKYFPRPVCWRVGGFCQWKGRRSWRNPQKFDEEGKKKKAEEKTLGFISAEGR